MIPRPYQLAGIEAIDRALHDTDLNPCLVYPTGSGKSPIIAWIIEKYAATYPALRVCIIAHVKELVQQNHAKLMAIAPQLDHGVFCAGLARKEKNAILYASIQSIYRKAHAFEAFDLIIIDEVHHVPLHGEGMYRKFIDDATEINPDLRVLGVTATDYRLDGGTIIGKDNIMQMIAYKADVKELINDGYLCKITSKHGKATPDTSKLHFLGGDFNQKEIDELLEDTEKVSLAVEESLRLAEGRKRVLWFCSSIKHAYMVVDELRASREDSRMIYSGMKVSDREEAFAYFGAGYIRHLVNINIASEGYDNPLIDCIVQLRPTASAGLYVQQIGRGLRIHHFSPIPSILSCVRP